MTPRRGNGGPAQRGRQAAPPALNEAARLTTELLDAGFTKKDVATIIDRDSSLVSQFFSHNKGASFVEALRNAVEALHIGVASDVEDLKAIARRTTSKGTAARVRISDIVLTQHHSSMARAAKQHIASGASRLYPVVADAASVAGKIAFTVRARKSDFVHPSGVANDSPGVRRNTVQRSDGSEERDYGNSAGPGLGISGFDAQEWLAKVDALGGDVAVAVRNWLVETGRIRPIARISHLEVRGWLPRQQPGKDS